MDIKSDNKIPDIDFENLKKTVIHGKYEIINVTHKNGFKSVMSSSCINFWLNNFSYHELVECKDLTYAILPSSFVKQCMYFNSQKECKDFKILCAHIITAHELIVGYNFFIEYANNPYYPEHKVLQYLCLEGNIVPANFTNGLKYYHNLFLENKDIDLNFHFNNCGEFSHQFLSAKH